MAAPKDDYPRKRKLITEQAVGGRPPKKDKLGPHFGVRLDAKTAARLDEISARHYVTRPAIARVALAFGLDVIDLDPSILFFNDEKERAERVLAKYWGAEGETGGATFDDAECTHTVWVLPRRPDGSLLEGAARITVTSKFSLRHALDQLARQAPPLRPLPWWPRPSPSSTPLGMPRRPVF
jgi:hypothetical protein